MWRYMTGFSANGIVTTISNNFHVNELHVARKSGGCDSEIYNSIKCYSIGFAHGESSESLAIAASNFGVIVNLKFLLLSLGKRCYQLEVDKIHEPVPRSKEWKNVYTRDVTIDVNIDSLKSTEVASLKLFSISLSPRGRKVERKSFSDQSQTKAMTEKW